MSSNTRNWNRKPGHPSFMTKDEKENRRRRRREKMEYRKRHGWTAQNIFASLTIRRALAEKAKAKKTE